MFWIWVAASACSDQNNNCRVTTRQVVSLCKPDAMCPAADMRDLGFAASLTERMIINMRKDFAHHAFLTQSHDSMSAQPQRAKLLLVEYLLSMWCRVWKPARLWDGTPICHKAKGSNSISSTSDKWS